MEPHGTGEIGRFLMLRRCLSMNFMKTLFLMTILTVLVVFAGGAIAGESGLYFALVFAFVMNFFAYWYSDKIAIKMARARPLPESQGKDVYDSLQRLTRNAGLPMPKVYLIPSQQPNAFASGRNPSHSVVAVTQGLVNMLNREELEGVLAHELAHIKNRDILIATIAAVMAGALTFVARMGMWGMMMGGARRRNGGAQGILQLLAIILAPIAAIIIRMAVSRNGEYHADKTAVGIAGGSEGLKNALLKLNRGSQHQPLEVNEAAAHMFIVNPLSARARRSQGMDMAGLFSTHPPIKERVKRLEQMR